MSFVAFLLGAGPALAQQPVFLDDGDAQLQPCLDDDGCNDWFTRLLSESLVQYGFVFQHDGLASSALAGKGMGPVTELRFDSLPLGEKNLATSELNLPPIVPRIEVGYQLGSFTFDTPYPQFAASVFMLPPLRVGQASAFSVGAQVSAAVPLGTHYVWGGAEAGIAWSSVSAPMVGDGEDITSLDQIRPFVTDLADPDCADTDEGCLDRFRQLAPSLRLGISIEPVPLVFVYAKGGFAHLSQSLQVAFDDTTWRLKGVQPQVGYGGGLRLFDKFQLSLGAVTAPHPAAISTLNKKTTTRVIGSFGMRFGDPRYWEADAPAEEADGPKLP